MRTGAIFARGSCRALKWLALSGVVFVLGAGSASAQLEDGRMTVTAANPDEGTSTTITVSLSAEVAGGTADATTVVVSVTGAPRTDGDNTSAETSDWTFNEATTRLELKFPKNESINSVRRSATASVVMQTTTDPDAEHEDLTVTAAVDTTQNGGLTDVNQGETGDQTSVSRNITIRDLNPQTYVLKLASGQTGANAPREGRAITVNLNAVPKHVQGSQALTLHIEQPQDYSFGITDGTGTAVTGASITLGSADGSVLALGDARDQANMATIAVTPPSNDGNRVADTVTLRAFSGSTGRSMERASLPITVTDVNTLPAVKVTLVDENNGAISPQPESVMEGETIRLRLDLAKAGTDAAEDLTISLVPTGDADALDYDLQQNQPIVIGVGRASSSAVGLLIEGEDEDVGNEMLSFKAVVSGEEMYGTETAESPDVLSLTILDKTMTQVEPKSVADVDTAVMDAMAASVGDEGLNPGESFDVMGSALFTVTDGYTATYAPSSSSDAVSASVAGDTLTIEANFAGTATVTVTANAEMAMSAATTTSQTVADRAKVSFDVIVADTKLMVTSLTAEPMEIDEGGMSTITAALNRAVTSGDGEVMIGLDVVGAGTLDMESISIAAGDMSGSAMLTATEDDDYMDAEVTVVASGAGIDGTMQVKIMVNDLDEEPVDDPTVRAKDGAADMIAAAIATAAGDADWMVGGMVATLDMSELFDVDDGVTAVYSGTSSDQDVVKSMTTGDTMLALTPMGAGSATITVTASDQAGGGVATVMHDAMVALQTLMIEVTASAHMVDEGGSVTLTAQANRAVTADTMLTLTVTGDTDAVEAPDSLAIGMGEDMGTAMVMAVADDDAEDEMVTVVVTGSGLASPVSIEIGVTDSDRTVVAKSAEQVTAVFVTAVATASGSEGWLPGGDAAMVDMSELFTTNGSPTLEYMAESSAAEMVTVSASGSTLTLTPMATGDATITVTATDTSGDADDHAMVMADVEVGVLPLMIELHGPDDMNLVEGMSYEITAMANRAVTEDTTVEIMRDRAESGAGEDDYSVESITIMAGDDSGTTMLMVEDDGPGDSGAGMPEMLVLYGMVGNMQTNSLSFYLWDAAVPALPIIAQLLLAALMAVGGYRRYRRR